MRASVIAVHLTELARLRNLQRGVHGHSIGYRRAADAIAELGSRNITSASQLVGIPRVGPKTLEVVDELLRTGEISQVTRNYFLLQSHHRSNSPAAMRRKALAEQAKEPGHAGLVARRRLSSDEGLELERA